MSFYLIIRGPLGCGKSTIAEALSKRLKAKYFAIDRVLDENNIEEWEDGYVSIKSFIEANEISAERAKKDLEREIPVIFDGNFYFKKQIEDLIERLDFPHYVFTLKAPLEVCIERDKKRNKTHGEDAVKEVFRKSTEFEYGIVIDINKPLKKSLSPLTPLSSCTWLSAALSRLRREGLL